MLSLAARIVDFFFLDSCRCGVLPVLILLPPPPLSFLPLLAFFYPPPRALVFFTIVRKNTLKTPSCARAARPMKRS